MNGIPPSEERKLFLVPRTAIPSAPPTRKIRHRLPKLANNAVIPLAVIFLAGLTLADYLCLHGNWDRAKDCLRIFLPVITALIGSASTARFRP